MYDYYGIYTACRDAAWRCLRDFKVCSLPVSIIALAHAAGISVKKNSQVNELREGEAGAGIFISGQWIIVYDDSLDKPSSRLVIAHELGHIFLGHEYKYSQSRFHTDKGKIKCEREADMFALRLLAPACVLHELGISKTADIASLCGIPKDAAAVRASRMKVLDARMSYYSNPLEREVASEFAAFIDENSRSSQYTQNNITKTE